MKKVTKITPQTYIGVYQCKSCGNVNDAWILNPQTDEPIRVLKCMGCGDSIPSGVGVFKLPPNPKTIGEKWLHLVGKPNFTCSSCGSEIPGSDEIKCCPSCGNPKDSSDVRRKKIVYKNDEVPILEKEEPTTDHFKKEDLIKEGYTEKVSSYFEEEIEVEKTNQEKLETFYYKKSFIKKRSLTYLGAVIGVAFVFWLIYFFFIAEVKKTATLVDKTWERSIEVQSYDWVTEQDWDIPTGGKYISKESKIHHYDKRFVRTDTKTRTVTERVVVGQEDYVSGKTDNGDGTFTDEISQRDVYGNVEKDETYTEDVYEDVPVYKKYYTYEIQRWVYNRTHKTSGIIDENNKPLPYWYNVILKEGTERISDKKEFYTLIFNKQEKDKVKSFDKMVNESEWNSYYVGQKFVLITNRTGFVKKLYPEK